jgi:ubiquinone/menaquinone biosynthesis C-methylase UbiE
MQEYYAARAREYDKVYLKPERQSDLRAIEKWLPPIFEGASILEVACGTGYWTQFLARGASRILAVDSAQETINIAETRVPAGKVEFLVGDAYALPRTEPKFDAGFAGFWYSHVPKNRVREFLKNFNAALKHGAKVVLLDNRFVEGSSSPISEQDEEGNTYQMRLLSDGTTHRVLKNFPSEAELRAAVEGIGSNVKYQVWPHFWALEYQAAST